MDEHTLQNGRTVRVNQTYTMNYDNQQLGLPKNTRMTVTDIRTAPNGISVYFECDFPDNREPMSDYRGDPTVIVADAMNKLLNDSDMLA